MRVDIPARCSVIWISQPTTRQWLELLFYIVIRARASDNHAIGGKWARTGDQWQPVPTDDEFWRVLGDSVPWGDVSFRPIL